MIYILIIKKKKYNFVDNNTKNIIKEITPVNSKIFNKILKSDIIKK